ncbi:MAG TPA: glutathione S-transferase N-terminal domain-containing protein [Sphingobium sp.]
MGKSLYRHLKGEQFASDYLAINPKGVVPVLVDDGEIIP